MGSVREGCFAWSDSFNNIELYNFDMPVQSPFKCYDFGVTLELFGSLLVLFCLAVPFQSSEDKELNFSRSGNARIVAFDFTFSPAIWASTDDQLDIFQNN